MGDWCCKTDDQPYFIMRNNSIVRNQKKKRQKSLSDVYKRYTKAKCYICDQIKYGRRVDVVYGQEFICIECVIDKKKIDKHQTYKVTGRYC